MFKIYLEPGNIHEATVIYTKIIKEAIESDICKCEVVYNLSELNRNDTVIVIDAKVFSKVYSKVKAKDIYLWIQGIMPEEIEYTHKGISKRLRQLYWTYLENKALKKAKLIFFVSEKMREHFTQKYKYNKNNYIIMPCFNKLLCKDSFLYNGKYQSMNFVYAGGLDGWQCVDKILEIFRYIKRECPNANFTILTSAIKKAQEIIDNNSMKYIDVRFVKLEDLDDELKKYKYGFLIREDNIVNNVATPTKLNTYMANGVIPIVSDSIIDYKEKLKDINYKILVNSSDDSNTIANKILEFNKIKTLDKDIYKEYEKLFSNYYNINKYKATIVKAIKSINN